MQQNVPKGSWLGFDFEDSHPDLPALYPQARSIIPVAAVSQHTGEASPTDDLTLLVAVDEYGKAQGILFEEKDDGYEYTNGRYPLRTYVAEQYYVVTVKAAGTEWSLEETLPFFACSVVAWKRCYEMLYVFESPIMHLMEREQNFPKLTWK